ncbi:MAG: ubiquinol-cytochrome c reductase iron-sulfur subunit N-terminal domain-containing protein [Micropepsaceae bacterium]
MSDPNGNPKRRDLLTTAALALTGVGGALAFWPVLSALGPDAETRAQLYHLYLKDLNPGGFLYQSTGTQLVLVFRRSAEELEALRGAFKSTDAQSPWQQGWSRSIRPDIMVCSPRCTRETCVVNLRSFYATGMQCPCCGTRYDLAGRWVSGIQRSVLKIPRYRFISPGEIEFDDIHSL